MKAKQSKADVETFCDICQRVEGKLGQFVIAQNGDTEFVEHHHNFDNWRYLHTRLGAKCDGCHVQQYSWLSDVPRGAKAVCADMVDRHFMDAMVAERYLAGQPSHRHHDVSVHMSPYEKRLFHIGAFRALSHALDIATKAFNSGDTDSTGFARALSRLSEAVEESERRVREADMEGDVESRDRHRARADAIIKKAERSRPRVVPFDRDKGDA